MISLADLLWAEYMTMVHPFSLCFATNSSAWNVGHQDLSCAIDLTSSSPGANATGCQPAPNHAGSETAAAAALCEFIA